MTKANFDEPISRIGKHSGKWDALGTKYDISPDDGLAMWVADTEFKPPQAVLDALSDMVDHGVFGYYGDQTSYKRAICGWMERRHDWKIDPSWIFNSHGLVTGVGLAVQTWTTPSDAVILFTPVYHAFARVLEANGRRIHESVLVNNNGHYELDLDTLESSLKGDERMLIFCSPHNPGGRVWTRDELAAVCAFCIKHDLILISDEIHHDLVFEGHKHTVMPLVSDAIRSRLVVMSATTKVFNLAGGHCGNVIIEDEKLRAEFSASMKALGISENCFGLVMAEAAYNHGEEWLEELLAYLEENKRIFDAGLNALPGVRSMNLEATFLAWVDFSGTGMSMEEVIERVEKVAKIATNYGPTFGSGGAMFLRFNIGCRREQIIDAVERMQKAFGDLQ